MVLYIFIALLAFCFYQDLRYRGIHWLLFPLLFGGACWINASALGPQLGFNVLFLAATMIGLSVYVSLREGAWINITQRHFAWGDILFLLALTPLFDFSTYLLFFTLGTCATLVMHVLASLIRRQKTIPYAGYMSVVSIAFLVFQEHLHHFLSL